MTNKEMKKLEINFKNRWVDYLHADYEAKFGNSGYTEDDAQRRLNMALGYSSAIFDVLSLTTRILRSGLSPCGAKKLQMRLLPT